MKVPLRTKPWSILVSNNKTWGRGKKRTDQNSGFDLFFGGAVVYFYLLYLRLEQS